MNSKLLRRFTASQRKRQLAYAALVLALLPLQAQAQPSQPGPQKVYALERVPAQEMAQRVRKALHTARLPGDVLIDERSNRLLVRGDEAAQKWAEQLIAVHDQGDPSQVVPAMAQIETTVEGYAVPAEQLEAITNELRKRYPTTTGVRIAPDTRASQLVVVAPPEIHTEIARYVGQQVGQPANPQVTEPRRIPGLEDAKLSGDSYRLNNITWRDLEDRLRTMWGNELQITSTPGGEVSEVRVASNPNGAPFMRIDRSAGEVSFVGDDKASRPWRQLTANIDRAGNLKGGSTQLVPLRRADPAKIRKAVSMIRDAALRTIPGETIAAVPVEPDKPDHFAARMVSMIFQNEGGQPGGAAQPAQPAPATQPAEGGDAPAEGGDAVAGEEEAGLLGDVQIEFIPELGVIILRGNKRDVQRVQQIIDEIEKQSDATQPEVEVVPLAHANSEALGELVTQVYTEVYEPRQGPLSITSLVKPNAILLVGRAENIDTAVGLITELDKPVSPDTEIRVFSLLHMAAVDAEQYINNFYGTGTGAQPGGQAAQGPRGLSTRVNVIADFRSNSLIVQASPRDITEVADLLKQLDVEKSEATVEIRLFPLKNSLATDVQAVLSEAFSVSGQAAPPDNPVDSKSPSKGRTRLRRPCRW